MKRRSVIRKSKSSGGKFVSGSDDNDNDNKQTWWGRASGEKVPKMIAGAT